MNTTNDLASQKVPGLEGLIAAPRILLIDDELDSIELASVIIRNIAGEHYPIDTASNGKIGVDKAASRYFGGNPYNVIFSDCSMPQMDGKEALEELRRLGVTTPFVFLTSRGPEKLGDALMLADDYINKTHIVDMLPGVVYKYL